jgi:hypothetical protein
MKKLVVALGAPAATRDDGGSRFRPTRELQNGEAKTAKPPLDWAPVAIFGGCLLFWSLVVAGVLLLLL